MRPLTIVPVQDACERPVSSLDSQIAELKSRRRSPIEFDEWKPSPFYYLYAPVGALLVYFLTVRQKNSWVDSGSGNLPSE